MERTLREYRVKGYSSDHSYAAALLRRERLLALPESHRPPEADLVIEAREVVIVESEWKEVVE